MKILVDMNLSPRWAEFLKQQNWAAVHWSSIGKTTAPDSEIMAFAANQDYIVLTYDLDFSAILAATHGKKPSVVQIRMNDISHYLTKTRVIAALKQTEVELAEGAILTIDENRTRLRLLPIKSD